MGSSAEDLYHLFHTALSWLELNGSQPNPAYQLQSKYCSSAAEEHVLQLEKVLRNICTAEAGANCGLKKKSTVIRVIDVRCQVHHIPSRTFNQEKCIFILTENVT